MTPPEARNKNQGKSHNLVKSPSDTTMYAPALTRNVRSNLMTQGINTESPNATQQTSHGLNIQNLQTIPTMLAKITNSEQERDVHRKPKTDNNVMRQISDFVDQLRIEHNDGQAQTRGVNSEEHELQQPIVRSKVSAPGFEDAQKRSERAILEAEKFRATVEAPTGNFYQVDNSINRNIDPQFGFNGISRNNRERPIIPVNVMDGTTSNMGGTGLVSCREIGLGLTDDDFFHLTCHIN